MFPRYVEWYMCCHTPWKQQQKKIILSIANNGNRLTTEWTNNKQTAERSSYKQGQEDVLDNLLNESSDSSVQSTLRTIDSGVLVRVDSLVTYR